MGCGIQHDSKAVILEMPARLRAPPILAPLTFRPLLFGLVVPAAGYINHSGHTGPLRVGVEHRHLVSMTLRREEIGPTEVEGEKSAAG